MAKKKNKKPKNTKKPSQTKQPKSLDASQLAFVSNLWSFSDGDKNGKWPLTSIDSETFSLRQELSDLERLDISQLKKKGCHSVDYGDLSIEARKRLEAIKRDDLDDLFSFRLSGKRRVWAIQSRSKNGSGYFHQFSLLWWDPKHEVCPSPKKHT